MEKKVFLESVDNVLFLPLSPLLHLTKIKVAKVAASFSKDWNSGSKWQKWQKYLRIFFPYPLIVTCELMRMRINFNQKNYRFVPHPLPLVLLFNTKDAVTYYLSSTNCQ